MSDKIKQLKKVDKPVDPAMLKMLEDIVGLARKGKIAAFALVAETEDRQVLHGHYYPIEDANIYQLIGALDVLKIQLTTQYCEQVQQ